MTKHVEVATADVVKSAIPGLAALASATIGDPAVHNREDHRRIDHEQRHDRQVYRIGRRWRAGATVVC